MTVSKPSTDFPADLASPNYEPAYTLAEQLRQDDRAEAQLAGMGTFVDNGWDRWHFLVTDGTPNQLTLQLQVADVITWCKRIEVHHSPPRRASSAMTLSCSGLRLSSTARASCSMAA